MADERDSDISRKYRELGAEEPPRALDEAILASSRRAVDSHPAPLVVPAGRRRWYFPVAAAAVITLAVAVTVQVERQKPGDEFVVATAPQGQKEERAASQVEKKEQAFSGPAAEQPRPAQERMRAPRQFTPEPPPATPAPPPMTPGPPASADSVDALAKSRSDSAVLRDSPARATAGNRGAESGSAPDSRVRAQIQPKAEQPAAQAVETRRMEAELQVKPAASPPAPVGAIMSYARVSPEKALEQIAELRKQGKHEEADKALAEFRKQYPDYRLTDEVRAKVERKK